MNKHELEIKDGPHRLETTADDGNNYQVEVNTHKGNVTFNAGDFTITGNVGLNGTLTGDVGVPGLVSPMDQLQSPDAVDNPFEMSGLSMLQQASSLYDSWQGTCEINQLAGNLSNQGWEAAAHQIKIIESEFNELKKGIAEHNLHELRDGIADVLFTVVGLAHRLSLPSIADFAEAVRANWSKFDFTIEDALKTRAKYEAIGVETYYAEKVMSDGKTSRWVTYSAKDQTDHSGRDYIAHKWLKSYQWKDVELELLPLNHTLLPQPVIHD